MRTFSCCLLFLTLSTGSALAQPECSVCPCRCPEEPGELKVFFGYLHSHTSYSDGEGTPREAWVQARDQGNLDFLELSPHNHSSAGKIATQPALYNGDGDDALINIAASLTVDGEFIALYGQEYSSISKGNHVNVIDAPTVISVANGSYDRLVDEYLPNHPDSFGNPPLLVLNHPDSGPRSREYGRDDFGGDAEWVAAIDPLAPIINLINGPSQGSGTAAVPRPEEGSLRFFLAKGFHLAPSVDQDNHRRTWGTIHDGRTAVVASELTKRAVLEALRARHAYATTDRNLRAICRVQDGLCGDVLDAPPVDSELSIAIDFADDDEPGATYQVEVYSAVIGGERLDFDDPDEVILFEGDGTLEIPNMRYHGGREYYFFRVTQFAAEDDDSTDSDRAWLAPVWFEPAGESPLTPLAAAFDALVVNAVAARGAELFHTADCRIGRGITGDDRLTGRDAAAGRLPHSCTGRQEIR